MDTYQEPSSRAPLFIVVGIVGLSVAFFFLFTKKFVSRDKEETDPHAVEVATDQPSNVADGSQPGGVQPPDLDTLGSGDLGSQEDLPLPDAARSELSVRFKSAPQPIRALAESIAAGSFEQFADDLELPDAEVAMLGSLFESGTWSLAPEHGPVLLGQFGDKHRWKLPLEDGSSTEDALSLYLDLIRQKERNSWSLEDIRIPPHAIAAGISAAKANGANFSDSDIRLAPDSLMTAESFMQAVSNKEYETAIRMSDLDSISRKKIAGLFIIFEEGGYRLRNEKALQATVATADSAWVIGQIQSDAGLEASDFGIELAREQSGWKVTGLHFSKLLASFATGSSGPDSVPYTPIVENPSGGESLVLYFGYDEDMLHIRAQRQLSIISTLLMDDAEKVIRITGHADALGTEDYNNQLSNRRALGVRDRLIELGVNPKQVVTEGFGESAPVAKNVLEDGRDNPEGRSKNRRTEIFLDF